MKEFLFSFPIKEYFDICLQSTRETNRTSGIDSRGYRLVRMIDSGYRQNGYRINWLLFCKEERPSDFDLSSLSEYVNIQPEDRLLSSGVTKEQIQEGIYPDTSFVFAQLSPDTRELVVGGFHRWDCVARIAISGQQRRIPTFIEEATTEIGFLRTDASLVRPSGMRMQGACGI